MTKYRIATIILLLGAAVLLADWPWPFMPNDAWGQPIAYSVQDLGNNNPIRCDFARFNYCQSEASLLSSTAFAPLSDAPPNTVVHFAYRGRGYSNYFVWPSNFKASSGGQSLVQYVQAFASGPWDQDFFFDGTNYIAETPGLIAANAGTYLWLFTSYLAVDGIAYGQVQHPNLTGNSYFFLQSAYLWMPVVKASVTITLDTSSFFSGVVDLIQDTVGGHSVIFAPTGGHTLIWATPTGAAPSLNMGPNANTVFAFYAASPTSIVGVPLGTPLPLSGSVTLGGSNLAPGRCTTGTTTITGAIPGDVVQVTPSADPNTDSSKGNFVWQGIVTGTNVVVVKLCAITLDTPASTTYNIRVVH